MYSLTNLDALCHTHLLIGGGALVLLLQRTFHFIVGATLLFILSIAHLLRYWSLFSVTLGEVVNSAMLIRNFSCSWMALLLSPKLKSY